MVAGVLAGTGVGHAAVSIFDLADRSDVVVAGTIKSVTTPPKAKLQVFTVEPARTLKGDAGTDLQLVQEMLFPDTKPYFSKGASTLVFVVPLPNYTSYREALGDGTYWRWTERLETAMDVAPLTDPALVEPLAVYLAGRHDPVATARHLGALLASSSPKLRSDALATLEARAELMPLLDTEALAPWRTFLADAKVPPAERAQSMVRLARRGAAGVEPIAAEITAAGGPLQAAAVDALVSLGKPPEESRLLAYSSSQDPALRVAAVRGLARIASGPALDRLQAVLANDPADEVRLATLQALGQTPDDRAVSILATGMRDADRTRVNAAAASLGRIASPAAIAALSDTLAHGTLDAQSAAAFALKSSGKWEAIEVLEEQAESHPDPRVRKVIELALGHGSHEH